MPPGAAARVGGIIWQVIVNLLTKAITAPFALMTGGGGGPDLSLVQFQTGTAQLADSGRMLAAEPLLSAAYMEYQHPQRLLMVSAVYLGLGLALYLAAAPYRLRDFFEWLFQRPARVRLAGAILLSYGLATAGAAFTY